MQHIMSNTVSNINAMLATLVSDIDHGYSTAYCEEEILVLHSTCEAFMKVYDEYYA